MSTHRLLIDVIHHRLVMSGFIFAAFAHGCRICLWEFAIVLKLENKSGEMQRL